MGAAVGAVRPARRRRVLRGARPADPAAVRGLARRSALVCLGSFLMQFVRAGRVGRDPGAPDRAVAGRDPRLLSRRDLPARQLPRRVQPADPGEPGGVATVTRSRWSRRWCRCSSPWPCSPRWARRPAAGGSRAASGPGWTFRPPRERHRRKVNSCRPGTSGTGPPMNRHPAETHASAASTLGVVELVEARSRRTTDARPRCRRPSGLVTRSGWRQGRTAAVPPGPCARCRPG